MGRLLLPLLALLAAVRCNYVPSFFAACGDYPASEHGMCAGGAAGDDACAQQCSTAEEPANPGGGRCERALCMCDGEALAGVWNTESWLPTCAEAAVEGDPFYYDYSWSGFRANLNDRHILTRTTGDADFGPITVYNTNIYKDGHTECDEGDIHARVQMVEVVLFTSEQLVQFEYQKDASGTTQIAVTVNGAAVTLPHSYANSGGGEFFTIYRHSTDNAAMDTSVGVRIVCRAATDSASVMVPRTVRFEGKFEGVFGALRRDWVDARPYGFFTLRNGTTVTLDKMYDPTPGKHYDACLADWTEAGKTTGKGKAKREDCCGSPSVQRRVRSLCKGKLARLAAQCKRGPYETAYGRRLKEAGDRGAVAKHQRDLNKHAPGLVKRRLELAMESCAADVCGSDDPCNAVANFEAFCASIKAGVDFDRYHTPSFCPRRQCPAASTWHDCAGCQPACGDEAGGDGQGGSRCARQCLGSGCICNKGHYFSEEQRQCVRANKCP